MADRVALVVLVEPPSYHVCIHKFDLFYMNVEFTRKGAVKLDS